MARHPLTEAEIAEFQARAVAAAEKLFAKDGLDGMTMRALAGELGCSPMTPYRYFENQEHLVSAVRTAAFRRLALACEGGAAKHRAPRQRIEGIGRAYIDFAIQNPVAYRLMFDLRPPTEPRADLTQASVESFQPLLDAVDRAIEAGVLHGDALTVAHVVWAGLHGLASLRLADKLNFARSVDTLTTALFAQIFGGSKASKRRSS